MRRKRGGCGLAGGGGGGRMPCYELTDSASAPAEPIRRLVVWGVLHGDGVCSGSHRRRVCHPDPPYCPRTSVRRCQEPLQTLHDVFQQHWAPFMGELGECVNGCYTEVARSQPRGTVSEAAAAEFQAAAQKRYDACCTACGTRGEARVPSLKKAMFADMADVARSG